MTRVAPGAVRGDDDGFTLIELMIVVLIIAILLAVAIPTFLGARTRAQDRAAESNLRNAFTAERTLYFDSPAYSNNTPIPPAVLGPMTLTEPSLTYLGAVAPVAGLPPTISITILLGGNEVLLSEGSRSGTCFYLQDIATGVGAGTTFEKDTACLAAPAVPPTLNGW